MGPVISTRDTSESAANVFGSLLGYCRRNEWAGYDPYDALNSRLLAPTLLAKTRYGRILLTQAMKRLRVNIRPLLGIPKTQNAKAMGLFLMALLKVSPHGRPGEEDLVAYMAERLEALRAPNCNYWCWGYSFPWQTRTDLVPRGAPNLVCTTFVAEALLDLYESRGDVRHLGMAVSAGDYILRELYWASAGAAGFSYPVPGQRTRVHNANLLGAALLSRIYKHSGDRRFLEAALKVARSSVARQHDDGSWPYGELPSQQWVDNFHTGYNLCSLRSMSQRIGTSEFVSPLDRGFRFYREHFVTEDGVANYFHNRRSPIDIHSVAQSVITLVTLRDLAEDNLAFAHTALRWAFDHMWDERGYFNYRYGVAGPVRISYMRWSQAWMLLALATFQEATRASESHGLANPANEEPVPAVR